MDIDLPPTDGFGTTLGDYGMFSCVLAWIVQMIRLYAVAVVICSCTVLLHRKQP